MVIRQQAIQSLQKAAQELSDEDLYELQRFADYLTNTERKDGARLSIDELLAQHEQQTSVLISYMLQRSRLISLVNRLANIIIYAETVTPREKLEAQEAIKKARWIH